jgi:hypothetical protein
VQVTEHASYLIMSGSGSRDHGDGGRGSWQKLQRKGTVSKRDAEQPPAV